MRHETLIKFPWWYGTIKWGVPLGLAFSSAALLALILTGSVMVPASMGTLQWLPIIFKSLEGLASFAALALSAFATSSMVGLVAATFVRAWVLFPAVESRANLAAVAVEREAQATVALSDAQRKLFDLGKTFNDTLLNVVGIFNQRLGAQAPTLQAWQEFLNQPQQQTQSNLPQAQQHQASTPMLRN
jgi:hypothetical protein